MSSQAGHQALELRDYLRVLRRRRVPLVLAIIVVVGAALASAFIQTPVYAATAQVLLERRSTERLFDPNSGQAVDPTRTLQTQIKVMQSEAVTAAVQQKLGYGAAISARPSGQTDVIDVTAESIDPKQAADIANAYAREYIDFRRKQSVDDVLAAATEVQVKIVDLQKQIDAASGPVKDTLVQQQALFRNKLDELQVNATLQSGGAQLVSAATVPGTPVRPKPIRTGIIALFLGVLFGIGIAFLIEYLDDSVKSQEDLEHATQGLSVMAMIPAVSGWKPKDDPRIVSIDEPSSPVAESYRTLRASIQFLGVDRPLRRLQVTSPSAGEGKTTTLANVGVALARTGARVVVVCCDLRRPRIHEFFGLSNSVGLTSVLLGEVALQAALQRVPGVDRLYVLASGPLPPNPSELLQSRRAAEVFTSLQSEGNFVLIDTPPVLPVSDALIVSKVVDATLMVCNAGKTSRKEVARSVELLRNVDAPLIGAVLNGVRADTSYGYAYQYKYYRQTEPAQSSNGNGHVSEASGKRRRRSKTRT